MAVTVKIAISLNVKPCSLAEQYHCLVANCAVVDQCHDQPRGIVVRVSDYLT
jgi:hypothetical protein